MMLLNCGIGVGCVRHPVTGDMQGNPDVFIAGESRNALLKIWKLSQESGKFRDGISSPFYGTFQDNEIPVERFFQRGNGCYRVLGAKEIQWYGHLAPEMIDVSQTKMALRYLEFLSKRTRGLKVIFLVRDRFELAKSAIWRSHENALDIIDQHLNFIREVYHLTIIRRYYSRSNVNLDTYLLDFESIKTKDLKELFSFLGEHYDQNRIDELLSAKVSFPS